MDLSLLVAILALLAWTLLPQLDRYTEAEVKHQGFSEISKPPLCGLVMAGHFFSRAGEAGRHSAGCSRHPHSA